ncbi:MAG: PAS domain S-box protein [Aquabacterium sp.]|jgi:diguanylate cyclase (GGDEF)-like protein/PAS domain S-box-containing protein|uniref:PAS domain S-box protein n=1 Tax=Aquabacterium sp. TaxID=1872578 RepID=UPI003BB0CD94
MSSATRRLEMETRDSLPPAAGPLPWPVPLAAPTTETSSALTRLAATLLEAPAAVIAQVDAMDVLTLAAVTGLADSDRPQALALCRHAARHGREVIVHDASRDPALAPHPELAGIGELRAWIALPLLDDDGHLMGMLCAIDRQPRPFTQRQCDLLRELTGLARHDMLSRQAQAAASQVMEMRLRDMQRRERLFQATFERAVIGIAIVSLDGVWLRTNPALCSILGRSAEELSQLTFQEVTHPDDLQIDLELQRELKDHTRDHFTLDKRYLRPDGTAVWGRLTVTLVRDHDGKPMHYVTMIKDITARRNIDTLQDLYDNAPCGYYSLDASGTFVQINETSLQLFGARREDLIGRRSPRDFFTAEGQQRFREVFTQFMQEGVFGPEEFDLLAADDQRRRISVTATALRDEQGRFVRSRTVIFDVSELHRTRTALQAINRQQTLMLDNELVGLLKARDRHVTWANKALERLLGYGHGELVGKSMQALYAQDDTYDRMGREAYPAFETGRSYRTQLQLLSRTGEHIWVDMSGSLLDADTRESLWTIQDISAMKKYQAEVETLAFHDSLTGLPNRMLLTDRLNLALASARRSGEHIAVCFGDMNGFKQVNDTHGHDAGDDLLREVGKRLQACVREHDTVARLGGDEFIILLTQLTSQTEADEVLDRVIRTVAKPVMLSNGQTAIVGITFGTAYGEEQLDAATLIARADARMYAHKRGITSSAAP